MGAFIAADAFAGKAVLVTGATSGIGAGTAQAFAAHGAKVMINGRDQARGENVLAELRAAGGEGALMIGDVADPAFCDALVGETVSRFGALDVLFNNAGVVEHSKIDTMSDDAWQRLIDINMSGSFYMARAAIRQMKRQDGGAIVNMSSECGLIAYENLAAYSATKGAMIMFTKCLAIDHAADQIRVNAVCPGDIDTPMMDQGWASLNLSSAEIRERLKDHVPIGRVGEPIDIAQAVMYLASDAAGFVTGVALPIDGGTTAR